MKATERSETTFRKRPAVASLAFAAFFIVQQPANAQTEAAPNYTVEAIRFATPIPVLPEESSHA